MGYEGILNLTMEEYRHFKTLKTLTDIYKSGLWKKYDNPSSRQNGHMGKFYPLVSCDGYKYFDTFAFKGKEYYINTIIRLSDDAKLFLRSKSDSNNAKIMEHYIDTQGREEWAYALYEKNGHIIGQHISVSPDVLAEEIVYEETVAPHVKEKEYKKDWESKEVVMMWPIVIVLLVVSLIFNGAWMIWIGILFAFGLWRQEKLEKPKENYRGHDIGKEESTTK